MCTYKVDTVPWLPSSFLVQGNSKGGCLRKIFSRRTHIPAYGFTTFQLKEKNWKSLQNNDLLSQNSNNNIKMGHVICSFKNREDYYSRHHDFCNNRMKEKITTALPGIN